MGEPFTDMEIDALREIGNIGAGNASVKISEILGQKVDMKVTDLTVIPLSSLAEPMKGNAEDMVVSIFLRVGGDVEGSNVLGSIVNMFQKDLALRLYDLMCEKPMGSTHFIDERSQEKFYLLGRETSQAYLNALCKLLGIRLIAEDPILTVNKRSIIMKFMMQNIPSYNKEDVLNIRTEFIIPNYGLKGEFVLLFGFESISEFRAIINKMLNQ